jgi:hypothetical protein
LDWVSGFGIRYHLMDVHISIPFNTNRPPEALAEAALKE